MKRRSYSENRTGHGYLGESSYYSWKNCPWKVAWVHATLKSLGWRQHSCESQRESVSSWRIRQVLLSASKALVWFQDSGNESAQRKGRIAQPLWLTSFSPSQNQSWCLGLNDYSRNGNKIRTTNMFPFQNTHTHTQKKCVGVRGTRGSSGREEHKYDPELLMIIKGKRCPRSRWEEPFLA